MNPEELVNAIAEIEREIAILPEGSITKKKIKDKEYYYHRITRNGKRVENYIDNHPARYAVCAGQCNCVEFAS